MTADAPAKQPPLPGQPASIRPPAAARGRRRPRGIPRTWDSGVRSAGVTLTLLAVALLALVGFLYFLSGVQEARAQGEMYGRLQYELGQALAPVGPTTAGAPVALLDIPKIGIDRMVVVEGTSPDALTRGPGHLRDTPLPGQGGISVIFGRRATFGAPFARLSALRQGDVVTTITGQGLANYQVIAVSNSTRPVPFSELPNQLLLVTADSAIAPAHYVEAEAKLIGTAKPEPGGLPQITSSESALGRDVYSLIPAAVWALALAAAAVLGSLGAARWARWPAWIATVPVVIAILWNLYQSLSALLPNLY